MKSRITTGISNEFAPLPAIVSALMACTNHAPSGPSVAPLAGPAHVYAHFTTAIGEMTNPDGDCNISGAQSPAIVESVTRAISERLEEMGYRVEASRVFRASESKPTARISDLPPMPKQGGVAYILIDPRVPNGTVLVTMKRRWPIYCLRTRVGDDGTFVDISQIAEIVE